MWGTSNIYMYIFIYMFIYMSYICNICLCICMYVYCKHIYAYTFQFIWNKIPVLAKLVMTCCRYTKSKWSYLNITVFWCCSNFLHKRKLKTFIKQTLHVHFLEPVNLLGLQSLLWLAHAIIKTCVCYFFFNGFYFI